LAGVYFINNVPSSAGGITSGMDTLRLLGFTSSHCDVVGVGCSIDTPEFELVSHIGL
jgi:hypothetical protein